MSWMCSCKPAHMTVRQFLEGRFNFSDEHCAMRIVDCAMVPPRTAYVAVEWVMKDTCRRQVIGVVFRFRKAVAAADENLCWQEMSEAMMPEEVNCPERILRLLTPTDDPKALRWREVCRQHCKGMPAGLVEKLGNDVQARQRA